MAERDACVRAFPCLLLTPRTLRPPALRSPDGLCVVLSGLHEGSQRSAKQKAIVILVPAERKHKNTDT